ncbi:AraC family transcriptional regulator [Paenibacillus filicis]|uniref:AraC family transcriptional regulator n=1 Tax=Paenibacillus gyeongsangnamensis TaxID=3388067 RepID=A0ABT4QJE4_9BACL|nr:AraC family transcriptional regulator [Paenibacillus filicis]MCZ8516907.1 AraC family transcriptional regulator [Paenibacillus filicis]
MKLIHLILRLKMKTNSLFIRLFLSFLIIIVMLGSFNVFSMTFSKNKLRSEVIHYNTLNLKTTTDNYEKEFELIKNQLLNFYFNENVQMLYMDQNKTVNYDIASKTIQDLRQMTLNPLLYLNNVMLYYKKNGMVLDKNSITRDSTFFNKFYYSRSYPLSFWQNQFRDSTPFRVHPPSPFYDVPFQNDYNLLGTEFPLIVKNNWYQDFYMAAFLDVKSMFQAFHLSINDNFFILDERGQTLFASTPDAGLGALPALDETKSYIKKDANYYFYRKGSVSGLTYVNVVPDASVASQIRLNVSLVTLLLVTIGISIAASILFSISINNPIQRIIQSIKQFNALVPIRSRINEFNLIGSQISQKNSQLKSFAYISSLKKIRSNIEMDFTDRPFVFVFFELTYKKRDEDQAGTEQNWIYYVREFIDFNFKQQYHESLTFQIESNQILSFVFMDESDRTALLHLLEKLKQVFEFDKEEGFATIAFSSIYTSSSQMTLAYEEVLRSIKQRRFIDETQIIASRQEPEFTSMLLPPQQEQEFYLNLQAGNEAETWQLVQRFLALLNKRGASSDQFYRFGEEIIHKTVKTLITMQVDYQHLETPVSFLERLNRCHTTGQLSSFLEAFLRDTIELINKKKEVRDPITSFVIAYMEKHYDGDITLDLMAEKLNITSGYLSTYFKEKTGVNFIDYLNDLRIGKAKEMLLESDCKIQDVARRSGYQNMNSFNRMFKKFSGITPSEFRKQLPM